MLKNLISLVILAVALYLLFSKKKKPASDLKELINYKKIHENGIVELENYKYRMVLEFDPINTGQMSPNEQGAVWIGFRDAINTLTIPLKFIVQSRYMDLKSYFSELKIINKNRNNEKLREASEDLADFYVSKEKMNRDYKYYAVLTFNAMDTDDLGSGIKVNNEFLNTLFKSASKGKDGRLSPDEYQTLAFNELDDSANVLEHSLGAIDVVTTRLNKAGVIDFLNYTFNRDMAPIATTWEADQKRMFTPIVNFSHTYNDRGGA